MDVHIGMYEVSKMCTLVLMKPQNASRMGFWDGTKYAIVYS